MNKSGKFFASKVIHLANTIYGIPVDIVIGDHAYHKKYMFDYFGIEGEPNKDRAGEASIYRTETIPISRIACIWLYKFEWFIADYETLGHECIHIAYRILADAGITITVDNQEPLTYLFSQIYRDILTELYNLECKEKKRLKKKREAKK